VAKGGGEKWKTSSRKKDRHCLGGKMEIVPGNIRPVGRFLSGGRGIGWVRISGKKGTRKTE